MKAGALLALSMRMAARELRAAEVLQLAAGVILAVASLASVGFFVDRAQRALQQEAAAFLGADLALQSDRPIDETLRQQAGALGLQSATTVAFPSMAADPADPDHPLLVSVKAVSAGYPLRGSLRLLEGRAEGAGAASEPLAPGSAWIDPGVRDSLGIAVGASLRLGDSTFRVAGVIASEPDRGAIWATLAPRVMIRVDDLAATRLVQPASRVGFRLLAAGPADAVDRYAEWLRPRLAGGQRLQSLKEGRPDLQSALDRSRQFLTLVALLAAMLSAAAIASSAGRFVARRIDATAVLRCLGLGGREVLALYLAELMAVGLAASAAGALLGWLSQFALVRLLAGLLPPDLPPASPSAALRAIGCGVVLLAGFGAAPLARLRRVAPLRVLRRETLPVADAPSLLVYAAAAAAFALLLALVGNLRLALMTAGAFAAAALLFAAVAWLWLRLLARARRAGTGTAGAGGAAGALGLALAAVARRPAAAVGQITAVALGLCALLVMAFVQRELVRQWQAQVPPDAPNRFIINIQPDQADAVIARLQAAGVAGVSLSPMIRGRLVSINGQPVESARLDGERARSLVEREFNLSYAAQPPAWNRIVEGRWFGAGARELSIEEGIAHTLGIRLGDRLCFDVAGDTVCAEATSLRHLSWDSMKVNFFVIAAPELLKDQPQSLITSIHVAPGAPDPTGALVRSFRNLTVIDTTQVLSQVSGLLGRVTQAVQFVVLFAVGAGVLVLYATVSSSQDEREREAALMRALGATRRRLWTLQFIELAAVGACAGALAGLGADAVGWWLARKALGFDFTPGLIPVAAGIAGGIACALAGGSIALRRVASSPPMRALREA